MKHLSYMMEAAGVWLAFLVFRMMRADKASTLGGWIGRTVGPHLGASKKARANLEMVFTDKTAAEIDAIIRDMWDNLGRVMAEYPHLPDIIVNRCEIVGEHYVREIGENAPFIVIGGHISNWELLPFYFNHRLKWPVAGLYRAPNNPYVEKLLDRCRDPGGTSTYIPKSKRGVREMVQTLQSGGRLAQLIDQKYNAGIAVPFLGQPAMTSPAFAQLAQKYGCPLVPLRVERLDGCNFRITIYEPFISEGASEEEVVARAHALLEEWIQEKPGQWLWLHRRWKSKALSASSE